MYVIRGSIKQKPNGFVVNISHCSLTAFLSLNATRRPSVEKTTLPPSPLTKSPPGSSGLSNNQSNSRVHQNTSVIPKTNAVLKWQEKDQVFPYFVFLNFLWITTVRQLKAQAIQTYVNRILLYIIIYRGKHVQNEHGLSLDSITTSMLCHSSSGCIVTTRYTIQNIISSSCVFHKEMRVYFLHSNLR